MDYEKKYKEALENAKNGLPIEEIFPELAESEDEKIRKALINFVNCMKDASVCARFVTYEEMLSWLEKQCEEKPSWSEEDENRFRNLIDLVEDSDESIGTKLSFVKFINRLKSLKARVQPKQEWSEEGEKMWSQVINEIGAIKSNSSTIFEKNIAQDKIDWLKSLKDRMTQ